MSILPASILIPDRIIEPLPTSLSICPKAKRRKRKSSDLEKIYTCFMDSCGKKFALMNSLQQHLKHEHSIDTRVGKGSKRRAQQVIDASRRLLQRAITPEPPKINYGPPKLRNFEPEKPTETCRKRKITEHDASLAALSVPTPCPSDCPELATPIVHVRPDKYASTCATASLGTFPPAQRESNAMWTEPNPLDVLGSIDLFSITFLDHLFCPVEQLPSSILAANSQALAEITAELKSLASSP